MPESIHVRGEAGQIIEMSLPLPAPVADRLTKGLLRRVHADGTPYAGGQGPGSGASDVAQGAGSALTEGRTPRPAPGARKAEWVGWAVGVHGMDPEAADAMTKADLQELPEQPGPNQPGTAGPAGGGRPADDAPKDEWITYTVQRGLLSAEDAAVYTRDDLIDLAR
ncbi:hypothetical protein ACIQNG_25635 [Streptomyces sp. NPDC091377]|uniref:hypothetical protein n=1 Tax=Streptomyces sp. NPDC091377 TaxID=3365995 RepID=UPI00381AB8C0